MPRHAADPHIPNPIPAFKSTQTTNRNKVNVKRAIVIVNPVGGKGKAKKVLEKILVPLCKQANVKLEIKHTTHAGHAIQIAQEQSLEQVDALCAIGGDGTLSELVTGYLRRPPKERTAILGFIPGGTGNALMREFSEVQAPKFTPKEADAEQAVRAILSGNVRKLDVVRGDCHDEDGKPFTRYSINAVHWGLGTDANVMAERLRCLGPIRYDLGILWEILRLRKRPVKLTLDTVDKGQVTRDYDGLLVSAMASKYTGDGIRMGPFAQLDDGTVDIVYNSETITRIKTALDIFGLVTGGGKHVNSPLVTYEKCTHLRIETPEQSLLNFDGENLGFTPLDLTVEPAAVEFFVPRPSKEEV